MLLPSDAEGFGLPVIEALACGSVVVASNLATVREVGGDAVVYCPVADLPAWVDTILRLLREPASAPARTARLQRAARYTWAAHGSRPLAKHTPPVSATALRNETAGSSASCFVNITATAREAAPSRVLLDMLAMFSGEADPTLDLHLILAADGPLSSRVQTLGVAVHFAPIPRSLEQLGDSSLRGAGRLRAATGLALRAADPLPGPLTGTPVNSAVCSTTWLLT